MALNTVAVGDQTNQNFLLPPQSRQSRTGLGTTAKSCKMINKSTF